MAKTHTVDTLVLEPRSEIGTARSHALRRAGKIPGVVYGHGGATPIAIEEKQLTDILLSGNRAHVLDASIAGTRDSVLLRRIESDPITRKPLSVDFQRVSKNEAISSSVPVATTGTPVGVRDQGGVMDVVLHAIEVRGPASQIPDNLTVDVRDLAVHEHLTAGQVTLPKGFTLVTPADTIVVAVSLTRAGAGAGTDNEEQQPTEAPEG
ncbi:MAG TPA: 50S ribosomal protein L25 [Candidatus Baltobacteraceae bacterium]|nr:50S ribosomal protein L25 [Candidatus Baltobacteraceae bacterium]